MKNAWSVPAAIAVLAAPPTAGPPALVELLPVNLAAGALLPPTAAPGGITGDADHFWLLDSASKAIVRFDRPRGPMRKSFELVHIKAPRGIAFDGHGHLWVADNETRLLHRLTLEGRDAGSIPAGSPLSEDHGLIVDLSWDGRYLWTAVSAGFASSFNQIDTDGKVLQSLFADCNPVGIAVRGNFLWSLCDNGTGRSRTLNRIQLDATSRATSLLPLRLDSSEGFQGGGLFFDGAALWTLDTQGPRQFKSKTEGDFP